MTTIQVKFNAGEIEKLLLKISNFDKVVDTAMGRVAVESYRRFIFPIVPKARSKKNAKGKRKSGFSGGALRRSYKAVRRAFLAWEIYSPLSDEQSPETPYGYWQEMGHTPNNARVFKNYSTPGTGKDFIKNAVKPTEDLLTTTVNDRLQLLLRGV